MHHHSRRALPRGPTRPATIVPDGLARLLATLAAAALFAAVALTVNVRAQETPIPIQEGDDSDFTMDVLVSGLEMPWAIVWGPDDRLWVTERAAARVVRIDPENGSHQVALTIDDVFVGPQHEGLLGIALHPELLEGTGNDHVYLTYTYDVSETDEPERRARIVRYTYDTDAETLGDPVVLLDGLPAWNDHNAGRLVIGPDGYLYYSLGEGGGNQGGNYQRPIDAQVLPTAEEVVAEDWSAYSGKVLRMDLDGAIPDDNPELDGVRSHVYTYGHRNPQGLAFAPDGTLYSSEHGPSSDDEVNVLRAGGNYGWPLVSGFVDDMAYTYFDWSEAPQDLDYVPYTSPAEVPDAVPAYPESEFVPADHVDPLATFFTVGDDYDFAGNCGWICNPTIAPSSLAYYAGDAIPMWEDSLLMPTLKHGALYVLPLGDDGKASAEDVVRYFNTQNRYRDVVIGPDGRTIYIATDSGGTAAELDGEIGFTQELEHEGAILVFTYDPEASTHEADETSGAESTEAESNDDGLEGEAAAGDADAEATDLFAIGQDTFSTVCVACHGAQGEGGVGPRLAGNEQLSDADYVVTTILHGRGYMPPFRQQLDDQEVAAVATYIRNAWDNDFGEVAVETAEEARDR